MTVGDAWVEAPTACSRGFAGPRSLCSGKPMEARGNGIQRNNARPRATKLVHCRPDVGNESLFYPRSQRGFPRFLYILVRFISAPSQAKGAKPRSLDHHQPNHSSSSSADAGEARIGLCRLDLVERDHDQFHHVLPWISQWVVDLLSTISYSSKASSSRNSKISRLTLWAPVSELSCVAFGHDLPGSRITWLHEIDEVCGMG